MSPTSEGEGIDYRTESKILDAICSADDIFRNLKALHRVTKGTKDRIHVEMAIADRIDKLRVMGQSTSKSFDTPTYKVSHNKPYPTAGLVCECGSKHTSNPNWHMNFCPLSK